MLTGTPGYVASWGQFRSTSSQPCSAAVHKTLSYTSKPVTKKKVILSGWAQYGWKEQRPLKVTLKEEPCNYIATAALLTRCRRLADRKNFFPNLCLYLSLPFPVFLFFQCLSKYSARFSRGDFHSSCGSLSSHRPLLSHRIWWTQQIFKSLKSGQNLINLDVSPLSLLSWDGKCIVYAESTPSE